MSRAKKSMTVMPSNLQLLQTLLTWMGRLGMLAEKALRVASDALRLVEYTKINPCTNSSRNSLAPWYDETITSTRRLQSSEVIRVTIALVTSLKKRLKMT